jgi:hypothetical protein
MPATVPASGGTVSLLAIVQNAKICRFSSTPQVKVRPGALYCSSGTVSANVTLPHNPTKSAQTYLFKLSVRGRHGTKTANTLVVSVQPQGSATNATEIPAITTEPSNEAVSTGQVATFTAAASGKPTPIVQWQRSTNSGRTWGTITGANATTYAFTATQAENGEEFQAVFANKAGTAVTSAASLTIATSPAVTTNPSSEAVLSGATATFTAAASGTPAPTVQWMYSTNDGLSWTNIAGATSPSYSFTAEASETGYQYGAVFTNVAGSVATNAATLIATTASGAAPAITTQPASQSVASGEPVTFTAAASGTPTPAVQWEYSRYGGNGLWVGIDGANSPSYTFTPTTSQNGYVYRAAFTSSAGQAVTSHATLTVTVASGTPPAITIGPVNEEAQYGGNVSYYAAATGNPIPTVQWQVSRDFGAWNNVPGATSATYGFAVGSSETGHNYQYRAVFTNTVNGRVVSTPTEPATLSIVAEQTSDNWSGYVATQEIFSSVSGSWTVPSLTCPPDATSLSASWVGIDGYDDPIDNATVEQDGTEADCIGGLPSYGAWFEMYGDDSVAGGYPVDLSYPVSPGDVMTASVSVAGSTWTLDIADVTQSWHASETIAMPSTPPAQTSAEWIEERPEMCSPTCGMSDLANFGAVSFTASGADGDSTSGPLSSFSFLPLEMVSDSDSAVLAAPSGLDSSGENFVDTWQAPD